MVLQEFATPRPDELPSGLELCLRRRGGPRRTPLQGGDAQEGARGAGGAPHRREALLGPGCRRQRVLLGDLCAAAAFFDGLVAPCGPRLRGQGERGAAAPAGLVAGRVRGEAGHERRPDQRRHPGESGAPSAPGHLLPGRADPHRQPGLRRAGHRLPDPCAQDHDAGFDGRRRSRRRAGGRTAVGGRRRPRGAGRRFPRASARAGGASAAPLGRPSPREGRPRRRRRRGLRPLRPRRCFQLPGLQAD
mmetsp:Transcript_92966/g.267467  ORF Transcript_92966/g.267467 Transcript_92966/m.267467 type:complete len:247 (+) Transcript_92966:433-1173(+)